MPLKAIIFLGNPGRAYQDTRHNLARRLLNEIPEWPQEEWKSKFKGLYGRTPPDQGNIHLLQPQIFMNLSGESVQPLAAYFQLEPQEILVIHDDLELPPGEWRYKEGGGMGGHKGLRSIKEKLGSADFLRLRLGIGYPARGSVASWVTGKFTKEEEIALAPMLTETARVLREFAGKGVKPLVKG